MTVTRDTRWRNLGRVPYEVWRKRITDAGGLSRVAERAVWEAAGEDSALMLEFLREESSYASHFDHIPASFNDPWNLQIAGNGIQFDTIIDCVHAWRERLYSQTYKNGVYWRTNTIADLVSVYAPASDGNDTESYIRGVVDGINRNGFETSTPLPPEEPGEGEPMPNKPGRIPKPSWIVVRHTPKDHEGQGFTYGDRDIVGWVAHETQGHGSAIWYATDFFACPHGDRCADALVDYIIDRNGNCVESNDPFGDRIPYASGGPLNTSNAIGRAFYNRFGDAARNKRLIGVEFEALDGEPLTPIQIQRGIEFGAWVFDSRGYDWDDWEFPAQWGGAPVWPSHGDIAQTSCRLNDADRQKMRTGITAMMKEAQTGGITPAPPVEPPTTPEPQPSDEIVPGMDYGLAARLFNGPGGNGVQGEDGKRYKFDRNGPASMKWIERGKATGQWPPIVAVSVYDDGRKYLVFADGWLLLDPPGKPPVQEVRAA